MHKPVVTSLAALMLGLSIVSYSSFADAAALGRLSVKSSLGQPLRAEIELAAVSPDELQSLSAKLASTEAFKQAGLEVSSELIGIRFALERRGDRTIINVSTQRPINEPYIDLLVELNWASGRLVREYTFLLDPPDLRVGKGEPAPVANIAKPATGSAPAPAARAPAAPRAPAPEASADAAAAQNNGEPYTVKRGDTLGKIARENKPQGVTTEQMLAGLYRANPEAFAGNINRLKTGAVIRMPDASTLANVPSSEARQFVSGQMSEYAAIRERLAGAVASAPGEEAGESRAPGQVTPQADGRGPKSQTGDQVKLAKPSDSKASAGGAGAVNAIERAAQLDQLAAKEKALQESTQRISELERNITELRGIVAAQNKALADAQKSADAGRKSTVSPEPAKSAVIPTPEPVKPPQPAATINPPPAIVAPEPAKVEPPKTEASKVEPPKAEPPKVEAAKKPERRVTSSPPAAPQQGFFEGLLSNPMTFAGLAGLLVLVFGYFLYSRQRKKKFDKFQDSILTGTDLKSNSMFGTTGGQSIDTTDSTFNSNFSPSSSQIDSNEVDPIAEADVYIAYGRDAQAEEILKEALKNTPERQVIRLKLLEIYANRRDIPAFEAIATEMHTMTGGRGEEWDKAAALGRSLDPRNSLYGGNDNAAVAGVAATVPMAGMSAFDQTMPPDDPDMTQFKPSAARQSSEAPKLDFDLGQEPELGAAQSSANGLAADSAKDSPLDLDFEIPDLALKPPVRQPISSGAGLDFNIELPPAVDEEPNPYDDQPSSGAPADATDLSKISLDLNSDFAETQIDESPATPGSAKQQEMATKLDLAAAYQEIGDREGAQELLDEVVRGGDSEQQQRARKMIETLS